MTDNGTQHSEGQKALLELESKFTAKKSSIQGTNGMQLRVLALFPRLFEDYPYPVVVTAAILKLADWFRQSNNVLKFHIYKVFEQSSEAHLPKLINTEETVRRILPVLYSNDYVARSITLRMLGCISAIIPEKLDVHHGVMQRLELAEDRPELEAAIWAADKFCGVSHRFLAVICSKLEAMIMSPSISPDVRTQLIRILRHMYVDFTMLKKALAICMNMLNLDPPIEEDQLKVVLSTIASLSKHSFLNRTEHISLLISYASKDCGQDLMCQVLHDLILMQDAQAMLSSLDVLNLMKIGCEVLQSGSFFLKYTYGRCLLILFQKNEPALQTIIRSSDPASHQQFKEFIGAIHNILFMESNRLQISSMIQYTAILNIIISTLKYCENSVVDEQTMIDMEEKMYRCLNMATDSLVMAPYTNHRKITLKKLLKLRRKLSVGAENIPQDFEYMLGTVEAANECLVPVLCMHLYYLACQSKANEGHYFVLLLQKLSKNIDNPVVCIPLIRLTLRLCMDTSEEATNMVIEDCFSKIKLFGGWNQTEGKFTKNQSYLWDIAKIAGQCKNFEIMYEVLSGIAGEVQTEASDCWVQAMMKLSRSEFLISSGIDKSSPDYGTACALLNKAIEDQVRFQTLMKAFSTMKEPRLFPCWYIQLRTEMLTLIKNTISIIVNSQEVRNNPQNVNSLYIRIERKIMSCAKDWFKLASRYQLLRKTIYNTDRQTAQLIDEFQIIALTFGYSLSSMKRSMMTFTHPALIPLFEDVSMMDEGMEIDKSARSLSIQVLRETDDWNKVPDMELAQRIDAFSRTVEAYCIGILSLSLSLPQNFFSSHKSVSVQMSVEPSLEELQPITLGSDSVEVMVIKFEGIVQRSRCKGQIMKATKADIVCFTTSQQISNIGDQMQALMIYDNPVMALGDMGLSACLLHPPTSYQANIVNNYFSTMGLIHLPRSKKVAEDTGSKRPTTVVWVNVLVRLVDDMDRAWITGPRYSRRVILQ
ncbi:hypothetical protein K450DRAFT_223637 [Umbelopsis ramanniana AG]|uniref:Integrator complex subunit 7 n=1 Tax=Umbelopsis ramanniana AG TaxID=1314678 RepID=A0AAD5EI32_UMBRA|nr:uncharacterized protein K450DRAFT_223637 [Umbelopsis ramanniana AG]KAI8583430.1 hypothetical protein K450DRAFT_223637 [Umbelopsis ramanniana AG]